MPTQPMTTAQEWHCLLQDRQALYASPTTHHRELLHQAYALRDAHVVDANTLAEMLELADAALEHALEGLGDDRSESFESAQCTPR